MIILAVVYVQERTIGVQRQRAVPNVALKPNSERVALEIEVVV